VYIAVTRPIFGEFDIEGDGTYSRGDML
jgi:hypothetical protein